MAYSLLLLSSFLRRSVQFFVAVTNTGDNQLTKRKWVQFGFVVFEVWVHDSFL